MSHILAKTGDFEGPHRWADFSSIFAHYNYEGRIFQFYDVAGILEPNSPNRRPLRVAFLSKTAILRERIRQSDFGPIIARCNYEGFHFPILRLNGSFGG